VKKDGPVVTDNGNFILDCDFGAIMDPESLETAIAAIPRCAGMRSIYRL